MLRWAIAVVAVGLFVAAGFLSASGSGPSGIARVRDGWQVVDRVTAGGTVVLRGGVRVRPACPSPRAGAELRRLLPPGSFVRLVGGNVVTSSGVHVRRRLARDGIATSAC